jgi:hypothetical protein
MRPKLHYKRHRERPGSNQVRRSTPCTVEEDSANERQPLQLPFSLGGIMAPAKLSVTIFRAVPDGWQGLSELGNRPIKGDDVFRRRVWLDIVAFLSYRSFHPGQK